MEKSRKVLFLITKSNFGGAQRYVYDLATHLPKEQFEVVVAAGGGGLLVDKLKAASIRTLEIPSLQRDINPLAEIKAFFEILTIIRREKPAILHLNSSKIGGLGALAGRLCGVRRIIFTAHGWEFNAPRPSWQKPLIRFFSLLSVFLAHQTIAISEDIRRYVPRILQKKTVVVHNGIEPVRTLSSSEVGHFFKERGVPLDRPIIGTLAELHPVKGLRYAIEAIARLREDGITASFVVMGEGSERSELEQLIRERHLEDSVFLLGFVPDAPRYLSAFTIFTLPSVYEGLSYALLEAGSAGLPVAAARVGGIPEVIEDGVSGILVPPCNPTALAEAFRALLSDDEQRYGSALAERVQTHFSLEKMLRETVKLYTQ